MTRVRFYVRWLWNVRAILARMMMWGVVAFPIGLLLGVFGSRFADPPPVVVTGMHEYDGVVVKGGMLELVGNVTRNRACPAETQRWLWRTTVLDGKPATEWVVLPSTTMPTMAPDGIVILRIPIPYRVGTGDWLYRSLTMEHCSWLPGFLGGAMKQSADVPVQVLARAP